ncbi:MAG TPA: type II secretion system F family protein [Vicinamibacteria bacterium]|nr:type II secretion system F family protein [Vicinamibacteria bacterium]
MEFVCKVGTPAGDVVERTFTASDEASLRSDLERQGLYLFSARRGFGLGDLSLRQRRVRTDILLVFCQELAALLKAGLPLYQSLDVMLERQRDSVFRQSLQNVRERVKSGTSLSDAFQGEGGLYPPIFSASLVAGERSGALETVLRRFVQYLRLNQGLKRKALAAAVYPMLLLTMMGALVALLLIVIIPKFESFYEGLNYDLPLLTRILIVVGTALSNNIVVIGLALVAAWILGALWLRRPGSGVALDRALMRLPVIGGLLRMYATSQLSRTLATLLDGGLPLLNAMEVTGASIGNRALAAAVSQGVPLIREGKSLTVALESTGMLDNLALEMVKVGEQTGGLADMLKSLAEFIDEELETRMQTLLALVEPLLLVVMAIVIAVMVIAVYLPLFEAISAVQGRQS